MTDRGPSVEVAALLKARGWSFRVLLLAAVGVLAGVIYNAWVTVRFMGRDGVNSTYGLDRVGLSQRAADFLLYGGNGPYLLPLAMLLVCGCFVVIHRPPLGAAGTLLWNTPTSRSAELQGEVVGLAVLAGVVALGVCRGGSPGALRLTSADICGNGPGCLRDDLGQQRGHFVLAGGAVDVLVDPWCPSAGRPGGLGRIPPTRARRRERAASAHRHHRAPSAAIADVSGSLRGSAIRALGRQPCAERTSKGLDEAFTDHT